MTTYPVNKVSNGMNRFMKGGLLALLFFVFVAPAYAANLPLLDPNFSIVPVCPTGGPLSAGAILQLVQNLMNAAISVGVIAFVLIIAYAGFKLILSPTNPESRSQAKSMLGNATVGFIIVLAAWLIVDFIMKILYSGGGSFGPWNKILTVTGDSTCIEEVDISQIQGLPTLLRAIEGTAAGTSGATGTGGRSYGVGGKGTGSCSGVNVRTAATLGGIQMSESEANTLACVAGPESACGKAMQNYNWGKGSSAYGHFQILLDGNARCFENSACYKAAGVPGPLRCSDGFRNGNPIPGSTIVRLCTTAAANLSCSAVAAHCVSNNGTTYTPWTGNRDSTAAHQACVANNK